MAALLGRLVVSLGVVIGLMVLAARMVNGRGRLTGGARRPGAIEVVSRQALSRNASVTIVRAGGRALVLGVTEGAINVLAEMDPAELAIEPEPAVGAAARPTLLDILRERTVRR